MSGLEPAEAAAIERVRLHRVSPTLGFAEVRLPSVNLHGLRIEEGSDGRLTIKPPERQDARGRTWPVYALQPETREAIEREVACLWARS